MSEGGMMHFFTGRTRLRRIMLRRKYSIRIISRIKPEAGQIDARPSIVNNFWYTGYIKSYSASENRQGPQTKSIALSIR